jgi:hypothetical protein
MDLFGSKRRKATQNAIDALRPLIGIIQHFHGLPPRFWTDEFVLGYIHYSIIVTSKMESLGLTLEDRGLVLCDAFTALSNQNGMEIGRHATELVMQPTPDFDRGAENARTVLQYQLGILTNASSHPEVVAAVKMADVAGGYDVLGALTYRLWVNEIVNRFGLRRS